MRSKPVITGILPFPGCVAVYSSVCAGTKYKLSDNVSLSFCMNMVLSLLLQVFAVKLQKQNFCLVFSIILSWKCINHGCSGC